MTTPTNRQLTAETVRGQEDRSFSDKYIDPTDAGTVICRAYGHRYVDWQTACAMCGREPDMPNEKEPPK